MLVSFLSFYGHYLHWIERLDFWQVELMMDDRIIQVVSNLFGFLWMAGVKVISLIPLAGIYYGSSARVLDEAARDKCWYP